MNGNFLFGDIGKFMDDTSERYDLCLACGVLYHQVEPLELIRRIASRAERVFLWTHFFDDSMLANMHLYPHFDLKKNVCKDLDGFRCMHYCRMYGNKMGIPVSFSGGSEPYAYWLSKEDILNFMKMVGFSDITVRGVNMEHRAGPTLSLLAQR